MPKAKSKTSTRSTRSKTSKPAVTKVINLPCGVEARLQVNKNLELPDNLPPTKIDHHTTVDHCEHLSPLEQAYVDKWSTETRMMLLQEDPSDLDSGSSSPLPSTSSSASASSPGSQRTPAVTSKLPPICIPTPQGMDFTVASAFVEGCSTHHHKVWT